MALRQPKTILPVPTRFREVVPLSRMLPFVSAHPVMVAGRLVRGRLRLVRAGGNWYLRREDYLALCEAAWERSVERRLGEARRDVPRLDIRPEGDRAASLEDAPTRRPTSKPIHDGSLSGHRKAHWRSRLKRLLRRFLR